MTTQEIIQGDSLEVLKTLPDESVDSCVTSPPYWGLRDYGVDGQLGLEPHFNEYIDKLIAIFDDVKRVLKKEGTCWVNLGDTYGSGGSNGGFSDKSTLAGFTSPDVKGRKMATDTHKYKGVGRLKNSNADKSLCQIPSRFALAMTDKGWILRNEIIWHKPNCMPQSVEDRFTVDFEKVFFFVKSKKYWFDNDAVKEPTLTKDTSNRDRDNTRLNNTPGRTRMAGLKENNYDFKNKRTVWTINTKPYSEAHFATFPEALIEPMILAGTPPLGHHS